MLKALLFDLCIYRGIIDLFCGFYIYFRLYLELLCGDDGIRMLVCYGLVEVALMFEVAGESLIGITLVMRYWQLAVWNIVDVKLNSTNRKNIPKNSRTKPDYLSRLTTDENVDVDVCEGLSSLFREVSAKSTSPPGMKTAIDSTRNFERIMMST